MAQATIKKLDTNLAITMYAITYADSTNIRKVHPRLFASIAGAQQHVATIPNGKDIEVYELTFPPKE